jgi:hypothetical protein
MAMTLRLDAALDAEVSQEADRQGVSKNSLIEMAVRSWLRRAETARIVLPLGRPRRQRAVPWSHKSSQC